MRGLRRRPRVPELAIKPASIAEEQRSATCLSLGFSRREHQRPRVPDRDDGSTYAGLGPARANPRSRSAGGIVSGRKSLNN
jgi:hypothetical protein